LIGDLKDIRSVQDKANRFTVAAYNRQPVSADRMRAKASLLCWKSA